MSMKAFNLGVIGLFLLLFGVSLVAAVTVNELDLTNCQLSASSYACSASVTASCLVTDLYPGTVITNVYLTIGSSNQVATLTSGTTTNGTWSVSIANTGNAAFGSSINLGQVQARVSDGHQCTATQSQDVSGCYVRYGATTTANNSCACQYIRTTGPITTSDTQQVTITPTAGCTDTTISTYNAFADFCDPKWVASYTACVPTNQTNQFQGQTVKTYTSGNPSCCAQTGTTAGYTWFNHNTGSDCLPPIDSGATSVCTIEPYPQYGRDISNQNNEVATTKGFNSNAYSIFTSPIDGNGFPALAHDFNGDGKMEILTIIDGGVGSSSYLKLLSGSDFSTLSTNGGSSQLEIVTGAPAISGIATDGLGNMVLTGNTPKVLVPGKKITGSPKGVVYVFNISNGNSIVQDDSIPLLDTGTGIIGATGINCASDICYFADMYSTYVFSYNTVTHAQVVMNPLNLGNGNASITNSKPVFILPVQGSQSTFIGFTGYRNFSGTLDGRLYITDSHGDIGVTNSYAVLSGISDVGAVQTRLTLRDATVVGRTVIIPFEEYYTLGGSSMLQTGVYSVNIPDTISGATIFDSTKKILWKNIASDVNEGISNAVSDGSAAYVKVSSRHASQSLSSTPTFLNPINIRSKNMSTTNFAGGNIGLSLDQNYIWTIGTSFIQAWSMSTGAAVQTTSYTGLTSIQDYGWGLDYPNQRFSYQARATNAGPVADGMGCLLTTDPNSAAQGCLGGNLPAYGLTFAPYMFGPSAPIKVGSIVYVPQVFYSNPNFYSAFFDDTYPAQSPIALFYSSGSNSQMGQAIAYDSGADIVLYNLKYIANFSKFVSIARAKTGTTSPLDFTSNSLSLSEQANNSILFNSLPSAISGNAFNFDWTNPRYIDTAGKKVKISSWNPLVYTQTTTSCGADFVALYYNADNHILGVKTTESYLLPLASSGTYPSRVFKGPQFAICDFSDESNPIVTTTGIYLDARMSTTTNSAANVYGSLLTAPGNTTIVVGWTMPYFNSGNMELDTAHPGSQNGTWRLVTFDQSTQYSCVDNGTNWMCGYPANDNGKPTNTCVNTAGYGPNLPQKYCVAIWTIDPTRLSISSSTGESTQVFKLNSQLTQLGMVPGQFTSQSDIALADVDADGVKDVVSSYGFYNFITYGATSLTLGSFQKGEKIAPLDVNGDGALDFLITGDSSSTTMDVSTPTANALLTGNLSVVNFRCSQILGSSNVLFQLAATAPTPSSITVAIDPNDGRGFVTQIPTSATGSYIMSYAAAGKYTPTVKVTSIDQSNVATATCNVNVSVSNQQLTGADCSLGSDGEFAYTDSVTNHNWKVVGAATPMPSNGKLYTSSGWTLTYPLNDCTYNTVAVEAKLIPGFNSMLQIVGSSETYGIRLIANRNSYAQSTVVTEDGTVLKTFTWDGKTYHVYSISVDRVNNKVYYYEDGVQIFVKDGTMISPQSVKIVDDGLWDYVRTSVSGTKSVVSNVGTNDQITGATQFLTLCDNNALAEASGIAARTASVNVDKYCASAHNGTCSGNELAAVVAVAPNCYKESYNYCTRVLYPASNKGASSSTAGVFCNALLMGSIGVGQIAIPVTKGFWNIIVAPNMQWILVGMVIILVILVAISIARRRGR